jgi:signal transduction histidine kinase
VWVRDLAAVDRLRGVGGVGSGPAGAWCRRTISAHRAIASFTVAAALFGCAATVASMEGQRSALSATAIAIATLSYATFALVPLLRWPVWLTVAVSTAGAVAMMASWTPDFLLGPALVLSMFGFSLHSERAPVTVAGLSEMTALMACHLLFGQHAGTGWSDVTVIPWIALAAAVGQAMRSHRAHQVMLEERARRAEEGRESEARRRVQQERLRIARELHDAVGHQVALISVQAGAMGYLLDADPDKARESLAHIQRASEAALEELRLTVGLLRQPGDREPTEPAGGLDRLGELISSFAATGLRVTCDVTGHARPLPEAVDLTAYRVIQESLTNTTRHAAGACARVRLAFRPGVLALSVEDDGAAPAPGAGPRGPAPRPEALSPDAPLGHGIIGMRERASALGGWLTAGPRAGGGFRVRAELPAPVGIAP